MAKNFYPKSYQNIFNFLTISGFAALLILFLYDIKLAILSTTFIVFCGIKFICIFITLIHGTFLLSVATLLALAILQPIFDNSTFILLVLVSIIAEFTVISISLQKIGINEKFSNLRPVSLLKFTAISAVCVSCAVSSGFFLLASPSASELLIFGLEVVVFEFLSPLMMFRALSFFH